MVAAATMNSPCSLQRLLDSGGVPSVVYGNIAPNMVSTSLLGAAARVDTMDCVRLLLPLETRPLHRDDALKQAVSQGNMEIVRLLVDEHATSARERGFHFCVLDTECPLTADLLLTRCWCEGEFPMEVLHERLKFLCYVKCDPELLAVYVAHGFDLAYSSDSNRSHGVSTTPLLMEKACGVPALALVEFLVVNGVPIASMKHGKTLKQIVDSKYLNSARRSKAKRLFGRCRDLLSSYDS